MMNNSHTKIIKKAANEILAPLGMFQIGRSRCWLDDNRWYVIQVEFQPSSWSKGAYLNVGISFLWEKSEALNNILPFDFGYRERDHVEFCGNEDDFYKEMVSMSIFAKEKVLYYRRFHDVGFCKQQLEKSASNNNSLWSNWNMAMFSFFMKDNYSGRMYLKRIIESTSSSDESIVWIRDLILKCNELLSDDSDLSLYVKNSIIRKRNFFCTKDSYRKLKCLQDINNVL